MYKRDKWNISCFCVILKCPVAILQVNSGVRAQKQYFFAKNFGGNEIIAYFCSRLLYITPINNIKLGSSERKKFQNLQKLHFLLQINWACYN